MKKSLLALGFLFVVFVGIAFAQEENQKPFLQARYNNINCHAQMSITAEDIIAANSIDDEMPDATEALPDEPAE